MLPRLKAERQIDAIEASSAPHLSIASHQALVERLRSHLGSDAPRPQRATLDDLRRIGFNVRTVSKETDT